MFYFQSKWSHKNETNELFSIIFLLSTCIIDIAQILSYKKNEKGKKTSSKATLKLHHILHNLKIILFFFMVLNLLMLVFFPPYPLNSNVISNYYFKFLNFTIKSSNQLSQFHLELRKLVSHFYYRWNGFILTKCLMQFKYIIWA